MTYELLLSLLTPIVVAASGLIVWSVQSKITAINKAQARLHDERRQIYTNVLEPIIRTFVGIKNPSESKKALKQILSFDWRRAAFEFTLIGSDAVVHSFNDMMQHIFNLQENSDPNEVIRLWGDFLLEMRRNVGDPKTRLTPQDMLRAHITNVESMFKINESGQQN